MSLVNARLPAGALPDPAAAPNRQAMAALGYPNDLNVAWELVGSRVAAGQGGRVALRTAAGVVTYEELWRRTRALAGGLFAAGAEPGARIVIHLPNDVELVVAWLATLHLGCVAVTTVPVLGRKELGDIGGDVGAEIAITTRALAAPLRESMPSLKLRVITDPGNVGPGEASFEALIASGDGDRAPAATSRDDVALVAYTSGSTGNQKGTIHTHGDVLAIADTYAAEVLAPEPDDVFICHAPIGFTYSLGALVVFPFRFGASSVLDPLPFHPRNLLAHLNERGVTRAFLTPTALRLILKYDEAKRPAAWEKVRTVVSAGEKLDEDTYTRFRAATGKEPLDGIGSTEMLHIWISQRAGESKAGCVGRLLTHFEARLLDEERVPLLGDGEAEGELAIRGPTGCRYWRQPERQRVTVRDGWTCTSDRFRRDAEGRYWHVSRVDDLIVCGGYNVSPAEVEMTLRQHPAVAEVAVAAVADELSGQAVAAYIVPAAGAPDPKALAAEVRRHARDNLAGFKVPRDVVFLDALPRTVTGKLNRKALGGS